MRTASSRRLRFFMGLLGLIAAGGALLGSVLGQATPVNALVSTIDALLIFGTIVAIEVFLPHTRHGRAFERSPFLVVFLVKSAVYLALIALEVGFRAGRHLVTALIIAGNPFPVVAQLPPRLPLQIVMMILTILIPFVVLVVQISRLVGEGTLRDIACGRYHRPRAEERFFLFVDVAGSTALAERIGPSAAHRFLRRVFLVASEAVDDHGGEIHQYVGDEMVVTWTLDEGARGCAPVTCYFAIERALAAAAEEFRCEFGAVPRLRAALHAGTVIAGEVGSSRRAIVFHGDVMNTTSRIEQATRELDRPCLVSEDAVMRMDGKEAFEFSDLGEHRLRGRESPIRLFSVAPRIESVGPPVAALMPAK